jgi:alpha-methylacyl-CoA racemase
MTTLGQGPLAGVRVLEFAGIGPGPHACMLLSDMGAQVIRIDRTAASADPVMGRGRQNLALDLKNADDLALCLAAVDKADVIVEGYRPGVMERLGLGPDVLLARNPRLIYGRMTGWGQDGPLAKAAGHDINYIALTGALAAMGPSGQSSVPPLNLVGDFGGGSLYLVLGVVSALYEREKSGRGQVIDAAIVDGAASLLSIFVSGRISLDKDRSMLGGAAPYYRCYICADGREVAIGALEPKFYEELCGIIGREVTADRGHHKTWAERSADFAELFKTKTRDEWCALLEGTDACFAPVLALNEAPAHPHMKARGVFESRDGVAHPAPAPRLSRTPGAIQASDGDGKAALAAWGVRAPTKE